MWRWWIRLCWGFGDVGDHGGSSGGGDGGSSGGVGSDDGEDITDYNDDHNRITIAIMISDGDFHR